MLLSGIAAWLELHKAKYGKGPIKPKYAWMWLFSKRLEDCEWLFDMFYVERQHQRIRAQAELVKNTSTFESSVLFRVVDAQCESLRKKKRWKIVINWAGGECPSLAPSSVSSQMRASAEAMLTLTNTKWHETE